MKIIPLFESGNHRFELHYSDGVRGVLKGNDKENLISDILKKKGVKEWALFKNDSKFHSTADEKFLVSWWGKGSFWYNRAEKEPELKEKEYKYKGVVDESITSTKNDIVAKLKSLGVVVLDSEFVDNKTSLNIIVERDDPDDDEAEVEWTTIGEVEDKFTSWLKKKYPSVHIGIKNGDITDTIELGGI